MSLAGNVALPWFRDWIGERRRKHEARIQIVRGVQRMLTRSTIARWTGQSVALASMEDQSTLFSDAALLPDKDAAAVANAIMMICTLIADANADAFAPLTGFTGRELVAWSKRRISGGDLYQKLDEQFDVKARYGVQDAIFAPDGAPKRKTPPGSELEFWGSLQHLTIRGCRATVPDPL